MASWLLSQDPGCSGILVVDVTGGAAGAAGCGGVPGDAPGAGRLQSEVWVGAGCGGRGREEQEETDGVDGADEARGGGRGCEGGDAPEQGRRGGVEGGAADAEPGAAVPHRHLRVRPRRPATGASHQAGCRSRGAYTPRQAESRRASWVRQAPPTV